MSNRILLVFGLLLILVLGTALMGYGSYRPLPKVRISGEQPATQKFIPEGKTIWQLYEFNFEGADVGEWQGGEGLHWYHDADPCDASGYSWRCYEPQYGVAGGYYDGWLQFLDTPKITVTSGQQLEFDHKWWVERFDTTVAGGTDYTGYGMWDCMGV